MHAFDLVSILAAISRVLTNPPHGSEQSAKVVARETSLKLLSMGNKVFRDNEKVADERQSPPFMFLFRTSDRPEIVGLRTKNINRTDIEEPKINEPGYHTLVEEASIRRIVTNPDPSIVPPDSLVVRLERSVIHNNDEPLSLTSSASVTPPGQRRYRVHYSSLNLFPDILRHLSPSPPAPVCQDTPVTPSFGCQLLLPPPTTDLSHGVVMRVGVVSLAIDAAAGVGMTFGIGRITRHVRCGGKDQFAWVRAVAARRGGVESRSVVSSAGNDAEGSAPLEVEDYFQHDIDSPCEAMLFLIRSDVRQDPCAKGYDMSILPSTHWEAERRTDGEEWQKVAEKELEDLKRMGVYKDAEELPEGKPESRVWYRLLRKTLKTFGFTRSEFDHNYITQEIWIHQELHIDSLLAEHNMASFNAVVTSLDPSYSLGRESDIYPTIDNLSHPYQHLVLLLQLRPRPKISNISFAVVLLLSQICAALLPRHYAVAWRYRVRFIAANHFLTSGNVIFDENIVYNSIHSIPTATHDCSSLSFNASQDSEIPAVPELRSSSSDLDHVDTGPMRPSRLNEQSSPSHSPPASPGGTSSTPPSSQLWNKPSMPRPVRTRSRDGF